MSTPTPTRGLFTPIFSEEENISILEDYKMFVETNGINIRNKWIIFHQDYCSLKGKYSSRQISKKIGGLEKKFLKQKENSYPLPRDPNKLRLFQLSESVWGNKDKNHPSPKKRCLTVTPNDQPPKKKYSDSQVEGLQLYHNGLILKLKQYGMVLQQMTTKELSPSKKKQTKGKEILTEEDPIYCKQQRDELEHDKELSLQTLDAGIFSKEDINISQDAQEPEAMDISIDRDCVEEKTENQLL